VLRSRKKVIFFGSAFIITTAVIYGLLIVLWHQLFSIFIDYVRIMQLVVGLLGLAGGVYFIREYFRFRKYGLVCETEDKRLVAKVSKKLKHTFENSTSIITLAIAVIIFSAILTIVEFPCSAAIPVIFAGILATKGLSPLAYLFYISLFILFYMFDEIVVFLIAVFTMKIWMTSSRFITWSALIASIILFLVGGFYLLGFFGIGLF
jgi:hypothetical protein